MSLMKLGHFACHMQNVTRMQQATTNIPYTKLNLQVASHLYNQGFISSIQKGSIDGPDKAPVDVTPDNISTRRIWLGLKYRDSESVISKFRLISKPSLRIHLKPAEVREFASGKYIRRIKPLNPSELVLIKCNYTQDVMTLSEALAQDKGGEILCRIS